MTVQVKYSPEAVSHLASIRRYIASAAADPKVADEFVTRIMAFCETLADFPSLGRLRNDIRPGLRVIGYRRRVVVAFAELGGQVTVLGVYYAGRDYESLLRATSSS